jgi:hypothetical protein
MAQDEDIAAPKKHFITDLVTHQRCIQTKKNIASELKKQSQEMKQYLKPASPIASHGSEPKLNNSKVSSTEACILLNKEGVIRA